jgi:tetratricopeptide (TPR) repeat protein
LRTNIREEDKKMVLEIVERAKRLLKENKVEEGEKFLIETVEKYPFVAETYYTLGYFYEEKKDFQKAINIYTKLIERIPEELEGYLRLGICYEEIGDYMKAYEVYKKSLEINLNQPEILKAIERIKTKIKF